ncbi:MAG: formylglycine-generating enzyme family protein [Cyanobacteria bacterium J06592_8]
MPNQTPQKRIIITRYKRTGQYFTEELGNGIGLDMVLIPGGTFLMGSPEDELESRDNERPQHEVTLQPFFMGRYTITQAQWRVVADYPPIERNLSPDPSLFKTKNRPVEQVSWYDAVEFCQRLSAHTERDYTLPSEAQWEYACRAGTQTPFHFGETITTDLANYRGTDNLDDQWSSFYDKGMKGQYRQQTTDVGSFPPNNFGLHDMHGNVWEWCLDDWHNSYEDAPTNGSAWFNDNKNLTKKTGRAVLRGGSWSNISTVCRSGFRSNNAGVKRNLIKIDTGGFRVVCVIPKRFTINRY